MADRFYLDVDQSGHWYVVPEERREDWHRWLELDEDDPAAWDAPSWANLVGGSPTLITFTDPQNELRKGASKGLGE